MRLRMCFFILLGLVASALAQEGVPESIYVVNYTDSTMYRVDPVTGASTLVTIPPVGVPPGPAGLDGCKIANSTTAYTLGWDDAQAYSVNLETGVSTRITSAPIGAFFGLSNLALADSTTAYVLNATDNGLYRLNLQDGSHSALVLSSPLSSPNGIVLRGNVAYIVGYVTQNIYRVNLLDGMTTPIATSIPGSQILSGIGLVRNTAYITSYADFTTSFANNNVYAVDLSTGEATLLTQIPGTPQIYDIAIVDGKIAYTGGGSDNLVYAIDLETGAYSIVTPTPVPGSLGSNIGLFGLGVFPPQPPIPPDIPIQGLSGNLLTFANYLNANAPESTLALFSSLQGTELTQALTAAVPTRLGFATFAAQNGYLASAQTVTDHLHQRRFSHPRQKSSSQMTAQNLLADAKGRVATRPQKPCLNKGYCTGWLTGLGEYAREKAQRQTPAFSASVGGAVLGLDYNCANDNVIGIGGSYAYTHVHEDKDMGHANINQGFLGLYGTLHAGKVYFDLGAWGGYYHTDNSRKIAFPGFDKTAASSTHGWQAAPHFEVGYDGYFSNVCQMQWFGVSPFLLADWVASWEHRFSEHGAGPLNMQQRGKFASLLRGETGLRFHEIVTCGWGYLVFQEKGSYAYQKMFHTGSVTALLIGAPSSFTVTTLTGAQNLGVAEFSMLFKPSKQRLPYVELRYQGEFGSHYQSHQGMLEIGQDF